MEANIVKITEDEGVIKTILKEGSGENPKPTNIVHG